MNSKEQMKSYKHLYSRFLAQDPKRLHFAAHSHYLWPDASRDAHIAAWDDAARLVDSKWGHVFSAVVPQAQANVARTLHLTRPEQIAFAPNTHEFVTRLLSCLPRERRLFVVTTDSEFMSFSRQIARFEEAGLADVRRVNVEPFDTFEARFRETVAGSAADFVYFSQVFFCSGVIVRDLRALVDAAPAGAIVAIDGYHAFMAIPTDLRDIEHRAFYLAGGYKYAMAGEGACFMHVPRDTEAWPTNTGWYAAFGDLAHGGTPSREVPFSKDGFRFAGATFDPSALYRMNAVFATLTREGVDVETIHSHVRALQQAFLNGLTENTLVRSQDLVVPTADIDRLGHFLTFRRDDAAEIEHSLSERNVIVDHRGDRLRFGFGIYQDLADVQELLSRLQR